MASPDFRGAIAVAASLLNATMAGKLGAAPPDPRSGPNAAFRALGSNPVRF
jgi:hypothetical protein